MTAARPLERFREAPIRFTAEEFMELVRHPPLADRAGKIELVEGEIVHMAPANIPHWRVQHDVAQKLRAIFAAIRGEWIVGPEPTVRFDDSSIRLPDVGVFDRPDMTRPIFDVVALFLAVEVADSSLRLDLGPKLSIYAGANVANYWVVDLRGRSTIVMSEPAGASYSRSMPYPFGTAIPVPGTDASIVIE